MPKQDDERADVAQLIDELLLGPTAIHSTRLLPRSVSRQSTLLSQEVVYTDLSVEAAIFPGDVGLEDALVAIRKSILYNFPEFSEVEITIDGQIPFEPPYENFQNSL